MIEFQYFEGCPNSMQSLAILREFMTIAKISEDKLEIVLITNVEMAQRKNFQGSPTILINGVDIYTMKKPTGHSFSCRIYEINGVLTGKLPLSFIQDRYRELLIDKKQKTFQINPNSILNGKNTIILTREKNKFKNCPECNLPGIIVKKETVISLLSEDAIMRISGDSFALCMNPDCHISYYCLDSSISFKCNEVNVPLWFKRKAHPIYACYCSKVTKDEVINAIRKENAMTVQDINRITGSMKNSDCSHHNPLGKCCHKIIQDIIDEEKNRI
jgi:bacterioferritin-associated ferredoxin